MNWHTIRQWLAILALLGLSIAGFWGVDQQWRSVDGLGRGFSTAMQTLYSVLGILAAVALLMKHRWSRPLLYLWAAAIVLTGATAAVVWGEQGWKGAALATAMTLVIAAVVIWLAPLPPAGAAFKRWRWLAAGLFALAVLAVLYLSLSVALRYGPTALSWKKMEGFCAGAREGVNREQLKVLAEQEGYVAAPGSDTKGPYLRIRDPDPTTHYSCEARFKPDGSIERISFSAKSSD
ncbi:MAG TPA: hypothetical protein VGT99_06305 [Gammaproteobacteria bacterium]|nr:hypothetical protein [Gammaproteobacteria bacterium]